MLAFLGRVFGGNAANKTSPSSSSSSFSSSSSSSSSSSTSSPPASMEGGAASSTPSLSAGAVVCGPRKLRIVSIGSSFASGVGILPYSDRATKQSLHNFGHQLAAMMDAELTDLTVTDAAIANILDAPLEVRNPQVGPRITRSIRVGPLVQGIPEDADIAIVCAGGNDIPYLRNMFLESLRCVAGADNVSPLADRPSLALEGVTDGFLQIFEEIRERAPNAKIYVVTYMTVFSGSGRGSGIDTPLPTERILHYHKLGQALASATLDAIKLSPEVGWVPMHLLSEGFALGLDTPWVFPFDLHRGLAGEPTYHPTEDGHMATAELLRRFIKADGIAPGHARASLRRSQSTAVVERFTMDLADGEVENKRARRRLSASF